MLWLAMLLGLMLPAHLADVETPAAHAAGGVAHPDRRRTPACHFHVATGRAGRGAAPSGGGYVPGPGRGCSDRRLVPYRVLQRDHFVRAATSCTGRRASRGLAARRREGPGRGGVGCLDQAAADRRAGLGVGGARSEPLIAHHRDAEARPRANAAARASARPHAPAGRPPPRLPSTGSVPCCPSRR